MRRRDRQGGPRTPRHLQSAAPHLLEIAQQADRVLAQVLAGRIQLRSLRRAQDKRRSDPVLECPDTTAESRLRDVPRLGGTREVSVFGERQEVLEPGQLHCRCRPGITNTVLSIGVFPPPDPIPGPRRRIAAYRERKRHAAGFMAPTALCPGYH